MTDVVILAAAPEIVLLAGVHFHFAGFALPVIVGVVSARNTNWTTIPMIVGVVVCVPLVGVGITISPLLEIIAAWGLAIACLLLVVNLAQLAMRCRQPTELLLLSVSAMSLLSAMILAAVFAWGEYSGQRWPDIPTMTALHGIANGFGFAFCGLIALQQTR